MRATSVRRRGRPTRALTAAVCGLVALGAMAPPGRACPIAVFRYALLRWKPGAYRVVIRHRGALSAEARRLVEGLAATGRAGGEVRTEQKQKNS